MKNYPTAKLTIFVLSGENVLLMNENNYRIIFPKKRQSLQNLQIALIKMSGILDLVNLAN